MIRWVRSFIACCYFLSSTYASAQVLDPFSESNLKRSLPGQEFFVGVTLGQALITVNLVNGVKNPGVYHLPVNTSLAELMAYSGGALATSDMDSLSIQRFKTEKPEVIHVDFERLIQSSKALPKLEDKDVIYIEQKNVDTTIKWLSIISTIASIGLSVALIQNIRDN